ncbi:hypothetical protein E2C01_056154 [Portunus trituberculatus]|uniref:Uncharacterized protein n=1 Tax=Portunus trituberculatus TaxID=210409 RepID=A0A5B7GWL3_PORTR|nr:hypothetical protein [Portunus trituberculatus]
MRARRSFSSKPWKVIGGVSVASCRSRPVLPHTLDVWAAVYPRTIPASLIWSLHSPYVPASRLKVLRAEP